MSNPSATTMGDKNPHTKQAHRTWRPRAVGVWPNAKPPVLYVWIRPGFRPEARYLHPARGSRPPILPPARLSFKFLLLKKPPPPSPLTDAGPRGMLNTLSSSVGSSIKFHTRLPTSSSSSHLPHQQQQRALSSVLQPVTNKTPFLLKTNPTMKLGTFIIALSIAVGSAFAAPALVKGGGRSIGGTLRL